MRFGIFGKIGIWNSFVSEMLKCNKSVKIKFLEDENASAKRMLGIHTLLLTNAMVGSLSAFLKRPNEPHHIYSLFKFNPGNPWVKYFFFPHEFLFMYSILLKYYAFTLFIRFFVKRIECSLSLLIYSAKASHEKDTSEYIGAYKSLEECVSAFNSKLKWPVCFTGGILFLYIVAAWFSCMKLHGETLTRLRIVFFVFGTSGFFYSYVMYKAMGTVHGLSTEFLEIIKRCNEKDVHFKRELKALSPLSLNMELFSNFPKVRI